MRSPRKVQRCGDSLVTRGPHYLSTTTSQNLERSGFDPGWVHPKGANDPGGAAQGRTPPRLLRPPTTTAPHTEKTLKPRASGAGRGSGAPVGSVRRKNGDHRSLGGPREGV